VLPGIEKQINIETNNNTAIMTNPLSDSHIRKTLSLISLLAAIGLAIAAMCVPPTGIIHSSVLWFTSQCFVFISGLLGINMTVDFGQKKMSVREKTTETETHSDK
jgi:hypothetical protein